MAVNLSAPDPKTIFPVAGVELGTTMASIRKANRRDMTVMRFAPGTHAAGVFTQNRFAAAGVSRSSGRDQKCARSCGEYGDCKRRDGRNGAGRRQGNV